MISIVKTSLLTLLSITGISWASVPPHPHLPQPRIGVAVDRGFVHGTTPVAGEQFEERLTGWQYLDMSLLEDVNQEQEAEPRQNPAPCGGELAAASTPFYRSFRTWSHHLGMNKLFMGIIVNS